MLNDKFSLYRSLLAFLCAFWFVIAANPVLSQTSGIELSLQAQRLYQSGRLVAAAMAWQSAADAFEAKKDRTNRTKSLINQSQVLQDLGLYPRACSSLLQAFDLENSQCKSDRIEQLLQKVTQQKITTVEGIGLRSLGSILQRKGWLYLADKTLQLSFKATNNTAESEATLLAIGNLRQALGNRTRDRQSYDRITEIIGIQNPANALQPYVKAIEAYQTSASQGQLLTRTQAQLNHLSLLIDLRTWWQRQTQRRIESWQRLDRASDIEAAENFLALLTAELENKITQLTTTVIPRNLSQLKATTAGIYAHLNYAKSLASLSQTDSLESILQTALQQALEIRDRRGESYALGYLGQYYGRQGELNRAISFTNEALAIAEAQNISGDAREIGYLWQSQLGKLLEQSGQKSEAIAAYTLAFNTLQSLRTDLNTNNEVVQFDFRQEVKPVYMSLANLLLDTDFNASKSLASLGSDEGKTGNNLELARQVIESLQVAELDNFFQDPCSPTANNTVTIDKLDPQAAVIYPIVLSDRLEVILALGNKPLKHFSTNISSAKVNRVLDSLYDDLYNPTVNNSAVNIFSTTLLDPQEIIENTQALLPNLHEIYRWLIEPLEEELNSNQIETLVFVLNGKLQNVPMAALYDGKQYLLEKHSVVLAPSLQLLNTESIPKSKLKVLAAGLSQQVEIQGEIFPALDNVPQELEQIKAVFPRSQQLLNNEFTAQKIEQQLQSGFPIVHLATHGVFSSDPEQTFIITGDRNVITIDNLSTLLGNSRFRPELLVLSACNTATGDERAVLGLAGVAVRSGSSTLASLWSVEDVSTSKLMSQFYRELENPTINKAVALRQAQLSAIESLRANPLLPELQQLPPHPYYWASYVLVGNWQ